MKFNIPVYIIFLIEKEVIFDLSKWRLIAKSAVEIFIEMLKSESCVNIMNSTDVNENLNLLLNTFVIF
jgi:hypothetical protein